MTNEKKTLTITLTARAPVTIVKDDWPIIARASDHDGQVESQADRTWRLAVRQHDDGRAVVYGVHDTNWQSERCRRGGEMLAAGEDIPAAIARVAATVGAEEIAAECVSDLPAVVLE